MPVFSIFSHVSPPSPTGNKFLSQTENFLPVIPCRQQNIAFNIKGIL
jgi:hypothetical protein